MKITHNSHGGWQRPSAVTTADYENQVQRSTDKAERLFRAAELRLQRAQDRLTAALASRHKRTKQRHIAELQAHVEIRRAELEKYRRMMVAVPASAEHRGRKSFRPVPPTQGSLIGRAS
jgi:hypothetical protein